MYSILECVYSILDCVYSILEICFVIVGNSRRGPETESQEKVDIEEEGMYVMTTKFVATFSHGGFVMHFIVDC